MYDVEARLWTINLKIDLGRAGGHHNIRETSKLTAFF